MTTPSLWRFEKRLLGVAAGVLTIALLMPAGAAGASEQSTVRATIPVGAYEITKTEQGHEVTLEDFGHVSVPGFPRLPARIFAIAIPPGAELVNVRFERGEGVVLPGSYDVVPAPLPRVIGDEDPQIYAKEKQVYVQNFKAVYASDDVFPQDVGELVGTGGYRKYRIVDVRITPFTYHPASGQLTFYPDITVCVDYRMPADAPEVIDDYLARTEAIAREFILNYDEAQEWYPRHATFDRGLYDFVVITLDSLTSRVTALVDGELDKGRTVQVVTTSWIAANYPGYDLAEQMRNFLREKYPSDQWGIEDVCLVGHYDDVMIRRCYQDIGYGKPETDLYFAELSLPDDQSWDANVNRRWGEDSDPIDFRSEVNVGRIPWSDPATVQHICEKSVAYDVNNDPTFKKNILLLGAFFWDNDPNPQTDNAVLMEAKVDQPWMADWTMTRMYEVGHTDYPCDYDLWQSNVVSVWSAGTFAFVNWAGHGSPTSSHRYHDGMPAFIASSDCPSLNDNYPAIIFADACSNSDTDDLNIGQAMLRQGGVGFLGATKVAFGCPGWDDPYDGSSQSLDYFFTTCVTSGDYTLGQGHQWALRHMYENNLWSYVKYEMFEWGAIWGNPNLRMLPPLLSIEFPEGRPDLVPPGVSIDITVEISEGEEELVPDSAMVYYRYYGGDFESSPLVPLGGDLYQATLPSASCDAVPEYYFSAEGTQSGVIYMPPDAPNTTYTFDIGEVILVFADDFETDQGWTVANENLDTGAWVRAVPSGGGGRGDPPADHDGSGRCYVTGNGGDEDVDGGPTRLTSPVFDVSDGHDYTVSYARWFYNDDGDDTLDVEISNGGGWVLVESVGGRGGWTETSFRVADYVTPTATVQLRFTTADQPNDSVTEAGVDAFAVFAITCEEPGEPILPDDYTIVEGQHVSGGLSDLFESDDSRLVLTHSGFFPPWVELEVVGTATTGAPSQLRFTFEGHPTATQVEQRIRMYDYAIGDWEVVDVRIMPTTDQVVDITISDNPARFIDPGTLEMKTRIRWMGISFLNLYGWNAEIDQTVWTLVVP